MDLLKAPSSITLKIVRQLLLRNYTSGTGITRCYYVLINTLCIYINIDGSIMCKWNWGKAMLVCTYRRMYYLYDLLKINQSIMGYMMPHAPI